MSTNTKERSSNWAFILYPESAPSEWELLLKRLLIPVAISPLHEPTNDQGEFEKKPHHHVFLKFDSLQSYSQVYDITHDLLNATVPQKVRSPRAMIRYFCHKDDPEKQQFEFADITTMNGFDINLYVNSTEAEVLQNISRVTELINGMEIIEYCDLVDYLVKNDMHDLFASVRHNASFYQYYITSKRHKFYRSFENGK